jgi:hypothetical protein
MYEINEHSIKEEKSDMRSFTERLSRRSLGSKQASGERARMNPVSHYPKIS